MKNKDNPVPSLDSLIRKFNKENNQDWAFVPKDYLITFGKWVKLQNGVESNKEKPNYKKAYNILMEYFDSISDEEQPKVHKKLCKLGL